MAFFNSEVKNILQNGVKRIILPDSSPDYDQNTKSFRSSIHGFREMCFCISGKSRYMLNDKVFSAVPGTIFMIDKWTTHAFGYLPEDKNLIHLWFFFHGDTLKVNLANVIDHGWHQIDTHSVILPESVSMLVEQRWNMIATEHLSADKSLEIMKKQLDYLLDEFLFQYEYSHKKCSEDLVEMICKYIRSTNARECSYGNLEKISGYSKHYLAHKFRDTMGLSIGKFIDQVRMEFVKKAMVHGLKQKEIAAELGFSSASNFWNWLQKKRHLL